MAKEIKLTQGKIAIVDDEDFERVNQFKWFSQKMYHLKYKDVFYAVRNFNYKKVLLHRFILRVTDKKEQVDHIDGNTLNCCKSNLRIVNCQQNLCNSRKTNKKCSSKYKGVYWNKATKKWKAQIRMNPKYTYLGLFNTEEEAAIAYNKASEKYHGIHGHRNIIGENNVNTNSNTNI